MIPVRWRLTIIGYFILMILGGSLWAGEQQGKPPVTPEFLEAQRAVRHYAQATGLVREYTFTTILVSDGPWPAWTRMDPNGRRGFVISFNNRVLRRVSSAGIHILAAHELCHVLEDGPHWGLADDFGTKWRELDTWECARGLVRAYGYAPAPTRLKVKRTFACVDLGKCEAARRRRGWLTLIVVL